MSEMLILSDFVLLKSLQMVVLIKLRGGKFYATVFISLIVIIVLVIAFDLAGAYLRK